MAITIVNSKMKAAQILMGDYVTAKGAGTLIDVGGTEGAFGVAPKKTFVDLEYEQKLGVLAMEVTKSELELKFVMKETDAQKLILAQGQPDANKTGTTPNFTDLIDAEAPTRYHQIKASIPGGGVGTTGLRELTFWRCVVKALEPIEYAKAIYQMYKVTVAVLEEITGTGADSLYKQVDS